MQSVSGSLFLSVELFIRLALPNTLNILTFIFHLYVLFHQVPLYERPQIVAELSMIITAQNLILDGCVFFGPVCSNLELMNGLPCLGEK